MAKHLLGNKLVEEHELLISPRDLGFSRGYAVFDFLRTYNGRPFKLPEHVDRLLNSATHIGLAMPWSKEELEQKILATLEANADGKEKYVKIMVSGGKGGSMLPAEEPTLIIIVDDAVIYPEERYEKGIGIITVEHDRYLPHAKTNNYIEGVRQYQIAASQDAEEPVYYSQNQVYEGSNSNVFAVIDGVLTTTGSNILPGITRNAFLELTEVAVRDFTLEELLGASEVFLTGSGKELTPVTRIDGTPVGNGEVGERTKEALALWKDFTWGDSWHE